jgi:hypothetical protein
LAADRIIDGPPISIFSIASGFFERIEVHRDEVDRSDLLFRQIALIAIVVPARQNSTVNLRVERLHATTEHLGAARELRHVDHRESRLAQRTCGPARRDQLDTELRESATELDESGLV